jgi:hypothetical protein|uniref:Uncharacterized protein n=1 Tax=viral metagenome TaxID=1070528 RepID=A0A6C0HCI9_9ZZZZ
MDKKNVQNRKPKILFGKNACITLGVVGSSLCEKKGKFIRIIIKAVEI